MSQTLRTTNDQQSNSMINAGSEQDHRAHTREDLHHEPKTSSTIKCSTIHKWFDWHLAITPNDGIDSQRFSYWKLPGVIISKLDLQCGSFRSCWPLVKDRPFSFGVSGLGMEGNPLIPVTFLVDTFGILRIPVIPSDYTTSIYKYILSYSFIYYFHKNICKT